MPDGCGQTPLVMGLCFVWGLLNCKLTGGLVKGGWWLGFRVCGVQVHMC